MLKKRELVERRRFRRFTVRAEAFYFQMPGATQPGEIIDIGMGGLAFYHAASQKWPADSFVLGTLLTDSDVILARLPVKSVSVKAISAGLADSATTIWRRGLQFGEISAAQQEAIKKIILTRSTGEAYGKAEPARGRIGEPAKNKTDRSD